MGHYTDHLTTSATPAPHTPRYADYGHAPSLSEHRLENRFSSKKSSLANEPVIYEFTNDKALLHQYYRLRVQMYRKVLGVNDFDEREDPYDKISHILIARKGKLCIGGCRLTVCEKGENLQLPMENEEFKLKNVLPELNLDQHIYAEAGRFAVLEDHNSYEVLTMLATLLMKKGIELGAEYCFARSEVAMARNWRKIVNNSVVLTAEILKHVNVPTIKGFPEIKMYLNVFTLACNAAQKVSERVTMNAPASAAHAVKEGVDSHA